MIHNPAFLGKTCSSKPTVTLAKGIRASLLLLAAGPVLSAVAQETQTVPPAFELGPKTKAGQVEEIFSNSAKAKKQAGIITIAHPGQSFDPCDTVVWSPLFQATWEKLTAVAGGLPAVTTPPNKLMEDLDTFRWEPAKVMPEGSWKVWGGPSTCDFLRQVNTEAAAITREPQGPFELMEESPGKFAAFGILDRTVEFQRAFYRSAKIPMHFRQADGEKLPVAFFGVRGSTSGFFQESVSILSWRPKDGTHAIAIRCKQENEAVILYRPPFGQDFNTACLWIRTWRTRFNPEATSYGAWDDNRLHSNDEVRVPYVIIGSRADLGPLLKGLRSPENGVPWTVTRAEQMTRFQLHEKGARVRVETSFGADPFGEPPPPPIPRKFIYDRPFFVFLWKDGAEWPYFGSWIGNASVMEKFSP